MAKTWAEMTDQERWDHSQRHGTAWHQNNPNPSAGLFDFVDQQAGNITVNQPSDFLQAMAGEDLVENRLYTSDPALMPTSNYAETQTAAQNIQNSGFQGQNGDAFYNTGNPDLNEALYGADVAVNLSYDGQGWEVPRHLQENQAVNIAQGLAGTILTGGLAGPLTGLLTPTLGTIGGGAAAGAIAGAAGNVASGNDWDDNLLTSAALGAAPGLFQAGVNALPDSVIDTVADFLPEPGLQAANPTSNVIMNFAQEPTSVVSSVFGNDGISLPGLIGAINGATEDGNRTNPYGAPGQLGDIGSGYDQAILDVPNGGSQTPVDEEGGGGSSTAPTDSTAQDSGSTSASGGAQSGLEEPYGYVYNGQQWVPVETEEDYLSLPTNAVTSIGANRPNQDQFGDVIGEGQYTSGEGETGNDTDDIDANFIPPDIYNQLPGLLVDGWSTTTSRDDFGNSVAVTQNGGQLPGVNLPGSQNGMSPDGDQYQDGEVPTSNTNTGGTGNGTGSGNGSGSGDGDGDGDGDGNGQPSLFGGTTGDDADSYDLFAMPLISPSRAANIGGMMDYVQALRGRR